MFNLYVNASNASAFSQVKSVNTCHFKLNSPPSLIGILLVYLQKFIIVGNVTILIYIKRAIKDPNLIQMSLKEFELTFDIFMQSKKD